MPRPADGQSVNGPRSFVTGTCGTFGLVTAFRVRYEGPQELAVGIATALADADGVDLTASEPPERTAAGVILQLIVEGSPDDVLDAVGSARSSLPDDARIQLDTDSGA